ncbi:hypothetical protein H6S82_01105 [Planktothrix sp. FACHB-1355]|uniref:Uncharacterized protein n=1 Tax=Aerosakkonema funiforme FACHB-1375 TaxID=2949571 RepID=A0A926VJ42_9CYAN|nr:MULTISPECIES: hypothetical protein [Oscillatoriales]MBD2184819.1 hypothetical protein [Aerosakkonema funiforme FACHB-1375]MBD3557467.1 hypothetical protein [Planktothrix sp. FACHB-1355]
MPDDFPCWLRGRARTVAEALLQDGFFYCGHADDFCESPDLETVGDWFVGGSYQFPGFDAICDGALFFKDYSDNSSSLTEEEFGRIKQLISQTQLAWDTCSNAGQLCLPGVA